MLAVFYSAFWEFSRELNLQCTEVILALGHSVHCLGTGLRCSVFPPDAHAASVLTDHLNHLGDKQMAWIFTEALFFCRKELVPCRNGTRNQLVLFSVCNAHNQIH